MIPYGKHHIDESDIQAVLNVLRSGSLTQGPVIDQFEESFANYVGSKYAVALSSGTAALHLAAVVAGVDSNSTLITSPITFVASANAGSYIGANVAFSDIDSDTVNLSPISLERTLRDYPNTKAIIPVHFAGLPCDVDKIQVLADSVGAVVIEDAAHALGACYSDGSRVGSCKHSLMTTFSFHPVKAIAAGEGGMITTNNQDVYRKLIRLRSHGINKLNDSFLLNEQAYVNGVLNPWYYEMQELGFHYRITEIQAALALSQLSKLDKFIARRRNLVKKYDEIFSDMVNCSPAQTVGRELSGHHLYVLKINFDSLGIDRANLMNKLRAKGIGTQVHYLPVFMHPYYRRQIIDPRSFINTFGYYKQALSIPLYFDLTDQQQDYIALMFREMVG